MASYKFLCVVSFSFILYEGCHSQLNVCGRAALNTKIVGGTDAPPGAWPWQASFHRGGHFCGGSIINNEWVITAAHCFNNKDTSDLTVYLGRQTQSGPNPNEVARNVTQIICHENYIDASNGDDICLVKLSSPLNFTNYIRPVCLAADGSTFNSGTVSWVTGWGTIQTGVPLALDAALQEVDVPIVGNKECSCLLASKFNIIPDMMCAGLSAGGKDSCQGDSGGPLVVKQQSTWIQAGVVSFGEGCALPNRPGVYARVSPYQAWINSKITTNQPGFINYTSPGIDADLSFTCGGGATTNPLTMTTTKPPTMTTTKLPTRPTTDGSIFGAGVQRAPMLALLPATLVFYVLVSEASYSGF